MGVIVVSECSLTRLSLKIVVEGIKLIPNESDNINLYSSVDNASLYNPLPPRSVIIFDVDNISPTKVFNTIDKIRMFNPHVFIMIFSRKGENTEDFIYLSALCDGVLCKTAALEQIADMLMGLLLSKKSPKESDRFVFYRKIKNQLTHRENEVLECLLSGMTNNAISEKLDMKSKTASAHRRNIYNKLGVKVISGMLKDLLAKNNK
ncbi:MULTISPECIES: LuxR C-terminal-related transcriptional regulator [Yersinia]|uniref:helix-turn-helix transcriptional regulator n=1 Tax=Yersinia TaxID=629 RepID=UPI000FFB0CA4|nr:MULTISPECIES: LuxR C-terminal-related transcriptional regulator [Yersinia]RXA95405.1 helix-turn-helix transcriptional regulator [Yersinia sp. 2105 StPb PI]